jgi:hypothetical protein
MSVVQSTDLMLDPAVPAFLKQHGAEAVLAALTDLIRTCFPDRRALKAYVKEDYDEPGWFRVVLEVVLPPTLPLDKVEQQTRQFDEAMDGIVPEEIGMLFVMVPHFAAE